MGRKAHVHPRDRITLWLPLSELSRVTLYLHSAVEGRVPYGAMAQFFIERIKEFFDWVTLDLAPYTGGTPGLNLIRGSKESIALLKKKLEAK